MDLLNFCVNGIRNMSAVPFMGEYCCMVLFLLWFLSGYSITYFNWLVRTYVLLLVSCLLFICIVFVFCFSDVGGVFATFSAKIYFCLIVLLSSITSMTLGTICGLYDKGEKVAQLILRSFMKEGENGALMVIEEVTPLDISLILRTVYYRLNNEREDIIFINKFLLIQRSPVQKYFNIYLPLQPFKKVQNKAVICASILFNLVHETRFDENGYPVLFVKN